MQYPNGNAFSQTWSTIQTCVSAAKQKSMVFFPLEIQIWAIKPKSFQPQHPADEATLKGMLIRSLPAFPGQAQQKSPTIKKM